MEYTWFCLQLGCCLASFEQQSRLKSIQSCAEETPTEKGGRAIIKSLMSVGEGETFRAARSGPLTAKSEKSEKSLGPAVWRSLEEWQ